MNNKMNFFKPFVKEKPKSDPKRLLIVIVGILVVFSFIYMGVSAHFKLLDLKHDCASLDEQLNDSSRQEAIERVDSKQMLLGKLNDSVQRLRLSQEKFKQSNIASDILISAINAQIPEKLFLNDINVSGGLMRFSGVGMDHSTISQFVYNLRKEEFIEAINIETITNKDSNYEFIISATLKDIRRQEAKDEKQ